MKQGLLTTTLLTTLFIGHIKGQKSTLDTILWDNGNYTLVSELTKVWIFETNGRTHKKVTIHTIDTLSGKVEYYFEGTYHDVLISNIELIAPAKFYDNAILFDKNKMPTIQAMVLDGDASNDVSFKSQGNIGSLVVPTIKNETKPTIQTDQVATNTIEVHDEIIFSNGKKLLVKIISIADGIVKYKRADLPNGPLYVVSLSIPGTFVKARITSSDHKTIDYRN